MFLRLAVAIVGRLHYSAEASFQHCKLRACVTSAGLVPFRHYTLRQSLEGLTAEIAVRLHFGDGLRHWWQWLEGSTSDRSSQEPGLSGEHWSRKVVGGRSVCRVPPKSLTGWALHRDGRLPGTLRYPPCFC